MDESENKFTPSAELLAKAKETVHETSIPGLLIVERKTFKDDRGFFRETYRKKDIEAVLGRKIDFEQGNHSRNESRGTLRGLHIAPWDKFIYVPRGRVQAVVAGTRINSQTFGQYFSIELGDALDPTKLEEERRARLWVPEGCANGYLVLSDTADYTYDTTAEWYVNSEKQIKWDDPDLKVKWTITEGLNLSDRDINASSLKTMFPEKFQP